jgi:maltooligosyltrehalose synthase
MTDEELIEELSEMGRHPCRAHLPMGETLRQAADRIEALTAEVERLRHCLKNANDKHEFYEREWYLRGDRIEALTAALVEIRTCTTEHGGAAKALRIINAALEKQP